MSDYIKTTNLKEVPKIILVKSKREEIRDFELDGFMEPINKIQNSVIETTENFIFETISPFCEKVMKVSKGELIRALTWKERVKELRNDIARNHELTGRNEYALEAFARFFENEERLERIEEVKNEQ